ENTTFANATAVGNRIAQYAQSGRPVVLGIFYEQDRSDGSPVYTAHGWGALESIDPNTTDGVGTSYSDRHLDTTTMVAHPLTQGVTALSGMRFVGGNQAKAGTIVVANWMERNANGSLDPAIAYRVTGSACVMHIGIAPNYPLIGVAGTD